MQRRFYETPSGSVWRGGFPEAVHRIAATTRLLNDNLGFLKECVDRAEANSHYADMAVETETKVPGERIVLKSAVKAAMDYLVAAYPQEPLHLLLEEVEMSEDGDFWLITLGFDVPREPRTTEEMIQYMSGPLGFGKVPLSDRVYKMLKVDARTGEVLSMKIRSV